MLTAALRVVATVAGLGGGRRRGDSGAGVTRGRRQARHVEVRARHLGGVAIAVVDCNVRGTPRLPGAAIGVAGNVDHAGIGVDATCFAGGQHDLMHAGDGLRGIGDLEAAARCGGRRLLTLRHADAGAAQGPALRAGSAAHLAVVGGLAAETEQAVFAGGQAEARQGNRVDLLQGKAGRQLTVDGDHDRSVAADLGGADPRCIAADGDVLAHHAVGEVLRGVDAHSAAGLNHGIGGSRGADGGAVEGSGADHFPRAVGGADAWIHRSSGRDAQRAVLSGAVGIVTTIAPVDHTHDGLGAIAGPHMDSGCRCIVGRIMTTVVVHHCHHEA